MKVLVVGSGGREHALAWKIAQSPLVKKVYCAPGNGGTLGLGEDVSCDSSDIQGLLALALKEKIDLTVVGPELPLTLGLADEFRKKGLKVFGPDRDAAQLEGSKVFAKEFMDRHRIPTAKFRVAETPQEAFHVLRSGEFSFPVVVKADGLAAGKGVIICKDLPSAEEAAHLVMVEKKFGEAGNRVVVEEFLRGKEASFIVVSDGEKVLPLVTTMDHKAAFDGDRGPNTGGMGAISPSPYIDRKMFGEIMEAIVYPTVAGMLKEGRRYEGVLYVGLMLIREGPRVLEYNCRFGDPETQPQVLRLESDLAEMMLAALDRNLLEPEVRWSLKASGCVVLASGGYPEKYEKGKKIEGLNLASSLPGITIFQAGTKFKDGEYYTDGGRVLGVCASEPTLAETMDKIYRAISRISFEAMHFRRDIGLIREE